MAAAGPMQDMNSQQSFQQENSQYYRILPAETQVKFDVLKLYEDKDFLDSTQYYSIFKGAIDTGIELDQFVSSQNNKADG